jgi:hypothetical protein
MSSNHNTPPLPPPPFEKMSWDDLMASKPTTPFTPTTAQIRDVFLLGALDVNPDIELDTGEVLALFDRWLVERDQAARASEKEESAADAIQDTVAEIIDTVFALPLWHDREANPLDVREAVVNTIRDTGRASENTHKGSTSQTSSPLPGGSRISSERQELIALLNSEQHAPMETHNPRSGECTECPWPLYHLSLEEIADALLATGYRKTTAIRAESEATE